MLGPIVASVFAIVSKKVFDKDCRDKAPGALFATDSYASAHKALDALAGGGSLFLATVRPGAEELWLVAVLEAPKKGDAGSSAAKNAVPITDISGPRSKIRFTTGTGITDKPGALAMSLQTPRTLADDDVQLLRSAAAGTPRSSR
jgi:hypothetical protein